MKEKDCKSNQVLNPKTKRCVKKDTKNGIEILFNQNDKKIHELYEKIGNKIVKKCEKPKIRNLITKRCVKEDNKAIKKPKSLSKKIEAIKKVKKVLSPFINRVSADIYHRNRYLVLMRRELKNRREGCLKVYKKNNDNSLSYRIGNRIILKKRIGTDSVYGIVHLSEFREKEKKVFTFASKVYEFNEKRTPLELEILTKLTNVVRMDLCPHFPLFYGYVICKNYSSFEKDSFEKSNPDDKTVSNRLQKFPNLIKNKYYVKFITSFIELANGDSWNFLKTYKNNEAFLINAIIQQLLSVMFFHYHAGRIHNDTHPGNFLYYKVKAGGYFHYRLFGIDYYLENLGFLWVIWDFDLSLTKEMGILYYNEKKNNVNDYFKVFLAFSYKNDKKYRGWNENAELLKYNNLYKIVETLHNTYNFLYTKDVQTLDNLKAYINRLPKILNFVNPLVFSTTLPKDGKIINKKPYEITKEGLFN